MKNSFLFFPVFGAGAEKRKLLPAALPAALLVALLVLSSGKVSHAGEKEKTKKTKTLVINTFDIYPYSTSRGTGAMDRVVREAFRRIGQKVKIVWLRSERALANADAGIDDGDYVRVAGLGKKFPGLVRVPVRLCQFQFIAFAKTKSPSVKIAGWKSFYRYNVGIPRGAQVLERKLSGLRSLMEINDQKALFRMLMDGRFDVIVYDKAQGDGLVKQLGLPGIRQVGPVLEKTPMYLYMNRRYRSLVPRLAKALRQMKRDGGFNRIIKAGNRIPEEGSR